MMCALSDRRVSVVPGKLFPANRIIVLVVLCYRYILILMNRDDVRSLP
jgi:hypothetical protein